MSEFIKKHKEAGRQLEFCFREVYSSDGEKFFVLVKENGYVITQFEISREKNKHWKVLAPAPQWVKDAESDIIQLVHSDPHPIRKVYQSYHAANPGPGPLQPGPIHVANTDRRAFT
jgi:hypothetical protein